MNKRIKPQKLTMKRESLRVLTPTDLRFVMGGRFRSSGCNF